MKISDPRGEMEFCPHCHSSLKGEPIPQRELDRDRAWRAERGLPPSGETHYSLAIGAVVPGVYDGTLYWQCPFCGGVWHRFGYGPLRERAQLYFDALKGTK